MSSQLYNNVTDSLAASVGSADTVITVSDGSKFPDPSPDGDYIPMYIIRATDSAHEIVHITGVSGNNLTVMRSQEDTDPLVFNAGDAVQIRPTRQSLLEPDASGMSVSTATGVQLIPSAMNDRASRVATIAALLALDEADLVDQQQFVVHEYATGTGAGGGIFYWDATSTETADEVNIFGAFTDGRFKRLTPALTLDNAGADPTGSTASDDALDRVLAALPTASSPTRTKTPVVFGSGRYLFNVGNHIATYDEGKFLQLVGQGYTATQIDYNGTETNFLDIPSEFMEVQGLTLNNLAGAGKRFLRQALADGRADIDCTFRECLAISWEYVHHCVGRGSVNIDCTLAGGTWSLVESPDPFTEGASSGTQTVRTGMRRYASHNLMVDSADAIFYLDGSGPAGQYINEVTINGVNGVNLAKLIDGDAGIWYLDVNTGSLVNSFSNNWAISARSVQRANIDVTAMGWYNSLVAPTVGINGILQCLNGSTTTEVLVRDVKISGVVGLLAQYLVHTDGFIETLAVEGLMCPQAYRESPLTTGILVNANGISGNGRILLDNIAFGSDNVASEITDFLWTSSGIPDTQVRIGRYSPGNVPVPLTQSNKGSATILNGNNSVTVNHGLNYTPALSDIQITPTSNSNPVGGVWWASSPTSTTFSINSLNTATADVTFSWRIERFGE